MIVEEFGLLFLTALLQFGGIQQDFCPTVCEPLEELISEDIIFSDKFSYTTFLLYLLPEWWDY